MQFALHHLAGEQQHVLHGGLVADAVPDHHRAVNAQNGGAPVVLVIETVQERIVHLHPAFDQPVEALQGLQHHVAGETVAHDHVRLVQEQVAALHIAHEVETVRSLHLGMGGQGEGVALFLLLADAQQGHLGCADLIHVLRVERAQQPELEKHLRLAVGVGAHVHHQPEAAIGLWQNAGDAGAHHPGHGFHHHHAPHQHRAGVARAGEGIQQAPFQHLETQGDAALGLGGQGLGGMVAHADVIPAGHDVEGRRVATFGPEAFADGLLVADQHKAHPCRQLLGRQHGCAYGYQRPVVAAHDVQTDPHAVLRERRIQGLLLGGFGGQHLPAVHQVVAHLVGAVAHMHLTGGAARAQRHLGRALVGAALRGAGLRESTFRIWHDRRNEKRLRRSVV